MGDLPAYTRLLLLYWKISMLDPSSLSLFLPTLLLFLQQGGSITWFNIDHLCYDGVLLILVQWRRTHVMLRHF